MRPVFSKNFAKTVRFTKTSEDFHLFSTFYRRISHNSRRTPQVHTITSPKPIAASQRFLPQAQNPLA